MKDSAEGREELASGSEAQQEGTFYTATAAQLLNPGLRLTPWRLYLACTTFHQSCRTDAADGHTVQSHSALWWHSILVVPGRLIEGGRVPAGAVWGSGKGPLALTQMPGPAC